MGRFRSCILALTQLSLTLLVLFFALWRTATTAIIRIIIILPIIIILQPQLSVAAVQTADKHTLVLVRHGESTWNLENKFTGWCVLGEASCFRFVADNCRKTNAAGSQPGLLLLLFAIRALLLAPAALLLTVCS